MTPTNNSNVRSINSSLTTTHSIGNKYSGIIVVLVSTTVGCVAGGMISRLYYGQKYNTIAAKCSEMEKKINLLNDTTNE